jgi:hypothetical protein
MLQLFGCHLYEVTKCNSSENIETALDVYAK